jgi:hypothetical protein
MIIDQKGKWKQRKVKSLMVMDERLLPTRGIESRLTALVSLPG